MQTDKPQKLSIAFDLRWVVVILIAVIAAMLFLWQPWKGASVSDQTITVTGETIVKAVPDEFTFYPMYQFKNSDKTQALDALAKKSSEVTAKLKELGVAENKIKTSSGGYETLPARMPDDDSSTYTLQLTVTVDNKDLAQKVQDYLLTTQPTGSVSPQPTFSEAKRQELEAKARDEATKDARAKAEQSAKNLGFKVGKVKSVSDGSSSSWVWGGIGPEMAVDKAQSSLTVNPGENELPYSIQVVYYVR